jgi:hypothetical protein
MNRRQFLLAQFGKSGKKRLSVSMLVDVSELPGDGWELKVERSWRVGKDGHRDEASIRAKQRGLFVAMRTFEQHDVSRWIYVKVIPMASREDALLVAPETNLELLATRKSDARVHSEIGVSLDIEVDMNEARATEYFVSDSNGAGVYRCVVGSVGHVVAVICCSGLGEGWTWQDIGLVINAQVLKIRNVKAGPAN